jgi:O-antigen ligase
MDKSKLIAYSVIVILVLHFSPYFLVRNYAIASLGVIVLWDKNILRQTKTLFSSSLFWMLLIPFFTYSFSIFYTNNFDNGVNEIEKKAGLLLFPIIFGLVKLKLKDFYIVLKGIVLLVIVLPVLGFMVQLGVYNETGDSGWFYNDNLVSILDKQAVYYALFVNTALLMLIYLWQEKQLVSNLYKFLVGVSLVLLMCTQYFLASRTSMLTTAAIISCYLAWLIVRKLNPKQGVILASSSVLLVSIMLVLFPKVTGRYKSITNIEFTYDNPNPINHFNGEIKEENWNGLNTRLAIWKCAFEEIKGSPLLGYGIGSVQQQLVKNYKEKNFILALKANYNSHNQYLDVLLTSGIVGLLLFMGWLVSLISMAFKQKNFLGIGFLVIFAISSLTENVLNRDQGVVFISLMLAMLLCFQNTDEEDVVFE